MVKLNEALGLCPEFEDARKLLAETQEAYTSLVKEYMDLTGNVRDNLHAMYMNYIGQKEFKLYKLNVEILATKREIDLYQKAINQGKQISSQEVKKIIDKEYAEYYSNLDEQAKEVQKARERLLSPKLSKKESEELSKLFRQLVKKLHPDMNPNLPEEANRLWGKIMEAYKTNDLLQLTVLSDLAEDLLKETAVQKKKLNSLETIQEQQQLLENRTAELKKRMKDLESQAPYCYRELLSSKEKIKERREELEHQILQNTNYLAELVAIRDAKKGQQ